MSYDTAKPYNPKGIFSGGFVDNTPEHLLNEKFSPYSRNTRQDGMSTVARPGYEELADLSDVGTGTELLGMGKKVVNPGQASETDRIVVRFNDDATTKLNIIDEDGNIGGVSTGSNVTSDRRMNFTPAGGATYCMNGEDDLGKITGVSTYSTPTTGITAFSPWFSVIFDGSHWASGWSDEPETVYKSVGGDYDDFASAGSDSFAFSETLTGLATTGQALFYFSQNTISVTDKGDIQDIGGSISYNTRPLTVEEGAVNHPSIVVVGSMVYFLSPSNKIVKVARGESNEGFEVYEISERKYKGITKFMSDLDGDQMESAGYFLPKENLIKWFVKSNGAGNNDTVIVLDIETDTFHIDETVEFFGGITAFLGKNYTISANGTKVYRDEYGLDDDGSAISFEYRTKNLDFGLFNNKKELWELNSRVAINDDTTLTQKIYVDGTLVDTKAIDSDNVPVTDDYADVIIRRTKGSLQVKGYEVQVRYTASLNGGLVRLDDVNMLIEALPSIQNSLTD